MRTTLFRAVAAPVFTLAAIAGAVPAAASAGQNLAEEPGTFTVSCVTPYANCESIKNDRKVKIMGSWYPVGKHDSQGRTANVDRFTLLASNAIDRSGEKIRRGDVNIDQCTKATVDECNGDPMAWRTVASGPASIKNEFAAGIYRACGAPIEPTERWLCTPAVNLYVGMPVDSFNEQEW